MVAHINCTIDSAIVIRRTWRNYKSALSSVGKYQSAVGQTLNSIDSSRTHSMVEYLILSHANGSLDNPLVGGFPFSTPFHRDAPPKSRPALNTHKQIYRGPRSFPLNNNTRLLILTYFRESSTIYPWPFVVNPATNTHNKLYLQKVLPVRRNRNSCHRSPSGPFALVTARRRLWKNASTVDWLK